MIKFRFVFLAIIFLFSASCSTNSEENKMFTNQIIELINAKNDDEEELALGKLLKIARDTNINYGYRVFNKTKNKRVMPEEMEQSMDDDLEVTIFLGEEPPYKEFKWRPKYNGHITRLVMP